MIVAAVPVKDFVNAKQRLMPALGAAERAALAAAMLEDVLARWRRRVSTACGSSRGSRRWSRWPVRAAPAPGRGHQPWPHGGGGARAGGGDAPRRARVPHHPRRRAVRDGDEIRRLAETAAVERRRSCRRAPGSAPTAPRWRRPTRCRSPSASPRSTTISPPRARAARAARAAAAGPRPRRRRAGRPHGAPRHARRHRQRAPRRLVAGRRTAASGRRSASVLSVRYEVIGVAGIGEVRPGDTSPRS